MSRQTVFDMFFSVPIIYNTAREKYADRDPFSQFDKPHTLSAYTIQLKLALCSLFLLWLPKKGAPRLSSL